MCAVKTVEVNTAKYHYYAWEASPGFTIETKCCGWNKLGDEGQRALEVWYQAAYDAMRREADLEDQKIADAQRKGGEIEVIDWTTSERAKFRQIAVGAWEDFAKKSPLAQEALDAHLAYMRSTGLLK